MKFYKNFFIALLTIYTVIFLFRFIIFPYSLVSYVFGFNTDAFYWSWCALELYEKGFVDFNNPYLFSDGVVPYFQGCFFGIGYTLITFLVFKMFGVNLKIMQVIIFLAHLINLYLFYRIIHILSRSQTIAIIAFTLLFFNPYNLFFSFAIRPDVFALLFALLSVLFAIRGKPFLSSIFFSISIFTFKLNYIVWITIILYFLVKRYSRFFSKETLKSILIFLISLSPIGAIYYIILYRKASTYFPNMIEFLSEANLISINTIFSSLIVDKFHLMVKFPLLIGLVSSIGILYIIGNFLFLPLKGKIAPLLPARSFNPLILPIGMIQMMNRFKFYTIIAGIAAIYSMIISIVLLIADFQINKMQNIYYQKVVDLAHKNLKICSDNSPVNGFLLYFYENDTDLAYKFKRNINSEDLYPEGPLFDCDVIVTKNLLAADKKKKLIYVKIPSMRQKIKEFIKNFFTPA